MAALDDAMNSRLSQILQMGSNANGYATQAASKQQAYDAQQQQVAYQKQMQNAMAKMQAEQQAALKKQQTGYQSQITDLMNKLGSNSYAAPNTNSSSYSGTPPANIPKGGHGNTFGNFLAAISGQESGGNYGAVNRSSGALGKYQIMPGNIASWSRAALGHSISTSQFLHSPQLQEQIAQYHLQNYYNKYGPGGAAVAWYAGEGTAQKYVRSNGSGFNAPQGGYPSINQYALDVLKRMGLR